MKRADIYQVPLLGPIPYAVDRNGTKSVVGGVELRGTNQTIRCQITVIPAVTLTFTLILTPALTLVLLASAMTDQLSPFGFQSLPRFAIPNDYPRFHPNRYPRSFSITLL